MSVKGGPDIETDGLVFHLDAAGAISGKGYGPEGLRVEYLIVGGGGGSAPAFSVHASSGGGGAGAFREGSIFINSGTSFSVVVGAGGSRTTTANCGRGSVGGDSSAFGLTSNGGAGAGTWCSSGQHMPGTSNGNASGSGSGGAGVSTANVGGSGGDFGNNGGSHTGTGNSNGTTSCGGGGGAGGPGGNGVANQLGGNGGIGKSSNITGRGVFYAGGGAGGSTKGINNDGGGRGGGGNRGNPPNGFYPSSAGGNGSTNSGGGGGGASGGSTTANGGNGGSGIVILRYRGKQKATGGTILYENGYTIHTFTSSGSFILSESVDGLSTSKIVGTLENMGPSDYSTGNKGYFSFDGSNQYIQTPVTAGNLGISSAGGKFSIDIWYRDNSDGSTNRALFTTFRGYNATIEIHANSTYRFYVNIEDNNGDRALFGTANNSYASGEWVNGTLVWDGSVKTAYVYLNGELQGYNTNTLVDNTLEYYGDPLPFRIGSTIVPNYQYGALPLLGDVASVKVYDNVALSEKQIKDNYNATKGRFGL